MHHGEAHAWFASLRKRPWATCAVTQLGLLRLLCNQRITNGALTSAQAIETVAALTAVSGHIFWETAPSPLDLAVMSGTTIVGHRQVTDTWLVGLAMHHGGVVATLDNGLVEFGRSHRLGSIEAILPRSALK